MYVKGFDMVQRKMVFLRYPRYVHISGILYNLTYEHTKNVSGSNHENNNNIQFRFSLDRKLRRSYKKKSVPVFQPDTKYLWND